MDTGLVNLIARFVKRVEYGTKVQSTSAPTTLSPSHSTAK